MTETERGFAGATPALAVVVPCFDEAMRFASDEFDRLLRCDDALGIILVDDGSTDATAVVLDEFASQHPDRSVVLRHPRNEGKGAAVATGMKVALDAGVDWVGFLDADLSTSIDEWLRLTEFRRPGVDVILGSRVRMLGADIERHPTRHAFGRVFATYASMLLDVAVYDTQCGAKLFRVTPTLRAAVAPGFTTTWLFDVELLERLLHPEEGGVPLMPESVLEVPLRRWHDVAGSSLTASSIVTIAREIVQVTAMTRRRRARSGAPRP